MGSFYTEVIPLSKFLKGTLFYLPLFLAGGLIYNLIECLYRGYTHISMFFAGGLCLALIALIDHRLPSIRFIPKVLLSALSITAIEFIFGIFLNVIGNLSVWDYSSNPYNLYGQICLLSFFYWVALSVPSILISRVYRRAFKSFFEERDPVI